MHEIQIIHGPKLSPLHPFRSSGIGMDEVIVRGSVDKAPYLYWFQPYDCVATQNQTFSSFPDDDVYLTNSYTHV